MINFVKYEFHKLRGKTYIWILLIIMLAVNIAVCSYTVISENKHSLPEKTIRQFFNDYFSDPDAVTNDYEERLNFQKEQTLLRKQAIYEGNYDYESMTLPNKYVEDNAFGHNDMTLFNELFSRREYIINYPSAVQKVINMANANLREFDNSNILENTYIYKYQLRVIELYTNARDNVKIGLEYNRGWDDYFNYSVVNIFIFFILLVIGSVVFNDEKQSGFLMIIHTTKNGRIKTAICKILTMICITVIIVILFSGSTFAVFGFIKGYSSPFNAIQVFNEFVLSPYIISVGEYFILTILFKMCTFCIYSVIIIFISSFTWNYLVTYILGFSFFGLNFIIYALKYIGLDNPLKILNFISISTVNPLFTRYRSINFFNTVAGYIPFVIIMFSVLFIVCSIISVLKFNNAGNSKNYISINIKNIYIKNKTVKSKDIINYKVKKKHLYNMSLKIIEIYKLLVSSKFIFIVIALVLLNAYMSSNIFIEKKLYSESIYYEYTNRIEGELTEDKKEYIINERIYINEILDLQDEMRYKYVQDEISYEEYREYYEKYHYAYSRDEPLKIIEDHISYLELREMETGVKGWTLYDTGWKLFFHNNFNILLYMIIIRE